ncbi:DivIVA protein [Amycolatopsis arida]|uniref:DivIVA protein n=1 Tax=Amycolatopsis arida TaxID=587909 RepID=A0A1I5LTH8_9PSEU|nr:hypothetical protein [Amycolatopsis arida]TDX93843.1 hypothetical protein CLV69_104300 [Amycolatopsis arida]SFP00664.1 DivIVA protein [Amycolatopsis arida]
MAVLDNAVDAAEPVPAEFGLAWRGYAPDQVRRYVVGLREELRRVTDQRDALVAELAAARAENRELRDRVDRICRTPLPPDALQDRLRRMLEIAHEEAGEIEATARAESAARAERLLDDARAAAEEMVAEARATAERMLTEARRRAEALLLVRDRVAEQLGGARRVVAEAGDLLRPGPAEARDPADG